MLEVGRAEHELERAEVLAADHRVAIAAALGEPQAGDRFALRRGEVPAKPAHPGDQ